METFKLDYFRVCSPVSHVLMFRADTDSPKNDAQLKGQIINLSFLKDWTGVFNIGLLVDILISNSFNKKKQQIVCYLWQRWRK